MPVQLVRLNEWEHVRVGFHLRQDKATTDLVADLARDQILDIQELRSGLNVSASSFVGRIPVGDLLVIVEPKIDGLPLMKLLRYAYGLRDLSLIKKTTTSIEVDSFQEILVQQLLLEARELIARGLHRQYVPQLARLPIPRGRLDFPTIARDHTIAEGLPCRFHPRREDCALNRVLRFGLHLGSRLANDRDLRSELRACVRLIEEDVANSFVDLRTIARLRKEVTRLTVAYQPMLTIVEIMIEAAGISLNGAKDDVESPGFVFDMNRFFQRLLARFLRENLPDHQVVEEWPIAGMMAYSPLHNPNSRQAPTPRPDFMVRSRVGEVCLFDAKYRDLWTKTLPREMLYQLSIYALSQKAPGRATILYPTLDVAAKDAVVCIRDPISAAPRAEVVLRPVNLQRLAELVAAPMSAIAERHKQREALRLISPPA